MVIVLGIFCIFGAIWFGQSSTSLSFEKAVTNPMMISLFVCRISYAIVSLACLALAFVCFGGKL